MAEGDNGTIWIPAILLSADFMCDLHKAYWDRMPEDERTARESLVGHKFEAQALKAVRAPFLSNDPLPLGSCSAVRLRWPDGHTSGCFSCEVSLD